MTSTLNLHVSESVLGAELNAHSQWVVVYAPVDLDEVVAVGIFESWSRGTSWAVCNLDDRIKSAVVPLEFVADLPEGRVILDFVKDSIGAAGVFADDVAMITWYADNNDQIKGEPAFAPYRKVA